MSVLAAVWSWFIGTKAGRFIVGAVLMIVALVVGALAMFERGKRKQADADRAKDAQSMADAAQQVVNAANARQEVENETAKLPDAPAQTVATADPATAAGQLRDDGWLRDDANPNDH